MEEQRMETIRMVIDAELLHEVDECARRSGLSRSSDRASLQSVKTLKGVLSVQHREFRL